MKGTILAGLGILIGSVSSAIAQEGNWMPITPPPAGAQVYPGERASSPQPYRGGEYDPNVYAPKKNGGKYFEGNQQAAPESQNYSINGSKYGPTPPKADTTPSGYGASAR